MGMDEYIEKWSVVNRLIDIENEIQQYKPFHGFEHAMYRKICEVEIAIGKTPDADVAPVRHERWNDDGRCTGCGAHAPFWSMSSTYYKSPYCFECGAKMDGGAACNDENHFCSYGERKGE